MPPKPKPRPRGQAPASRTYHSSPAPEQITFPARRRVVRTYGRKSASARSLRQQTLTQIDYVTQSTPRDRELLEDDDDDNDDDDAPAKKPAKERSKKRRKTMGDTPNSSFHTQTLTQFLSDKSASGSGADEDKELLIKDSDEEDEEEEADQNEPQVLGKRDGNKEPSLVPETPVSQRIKVNLDEVPSSQPTPFTPMLERYTTPGTGRSPLIDKSTNVDAPLPSEETVSKIPRNLTIQDTFSPSTSSLSSLPPSSLKEEPTPTNRSRRQPLAEIPLPAAGPDISAVLGDSPACSGKENKKRSFVEIPDSDDELDNFSPSPVKSSSARRTPQRKARTLKATPEHRNVPSKEILDEEDETTSSEDAGPSTPTPLARKVHIELPPNSSPSVFLETPYKQQPRKSSPLVPRSAVKSARRNTQRNTQRNIAQNTQYNTQKSQYYTQGLESQRVPFDVIQSLGPITERTDIVVSIEPEIVEEIAAGKRDHEFRPYKFPSQILRCWIYTALPVGEVKYMATLGQPKEPGTIDDLGGIGNADFNRGQTQHKFAYRLKQVYELNNPIPLSLMKKNGLGDGPPPKWTFVPPAIVGQLLGNLRRALFENDDELEEFNLLRDEDFDELDVEPDVTISQELEEQIRSDIIHSTQMQMNHSSDTVQQDLIPAKQSRNSKSKTVSKAASGASTPRQATETHEFALPPLPAPGTRSSSRIRNQSQRQWGVAKTPSTGRRAPIRPSQATTASQASTAVITPEKSSVPRPMQGSSIPSDDLPDDGSLFRFAGAGLLLGSSQPQILDSLLVDDGRPPPQVLDSEEEDDDDDLI
ncbi:hypothetical protein QBC47DRAFT_380845 [Echria macrotheca]|uniref:Uncharacterized protein n=1 Tax=Echria macrotheca TaxID=438768 RepID=A0AAJ0BC98_9PEZI|nr:hypothetical protein QBC47DRAFT_380845 [Echria macrotheca]